MFSLLTVRLREHVRRIHWSRALPTPYTLDRTGLPYRLTGVAANRTHTLTLATRPGTPRDARGERQCTPCTRSPTPRTDVRLCRSSVALRDGRWDPHESRDQLICAVPNSFLRQLSGEAEQRARRGVTRPWDRVRASGSPPRPRAPRALRLCAPRPMCDDRTVYRNALACYFCGRKPRTSHRAGTGTILMSQPSWNSLVRGFCSGGLSPLRRELAPRRLTP